MMAGFLHRFGILVAVATILICIVAAYVAIPTLLTVPNAISWFLIIVGVALMLGSLVYCVFRALAWAVSPDDYPLHPWRAKPLQVDEQINLPDPSNLSRNAQTNRKSNSSRDEGDWVMAVGAALVLMAMFAVIEYRYQPKSMAERLVGILVLGADLVSKRDLHPRDYVERWERKRNLEKD